MRRGTLVALSLLGLVLGAGVTRSEDGIEREADVRAFVGEHQPELLPLLDRLKPMNGKEYRKAIRDLASARDRLVELQKRGAPRYPLMLDSWKARTRVDILAARLAGEASSETEAKLREAIAANLDVEVRLQRFELEQAEAAVKSHRRALDRLETDRQATLDARFRAAQPRRIGKLGKIKDKAQDKTSPPRKAADQDAGAKPASSTPGENRR